MTLALGAVYFAASVSADDKFLGSDDESTVDSELENEYGTDKVVELEVELRSTGKVRGGSLSGRRRDIYNPTGKNPDASVSVTNHPADATVVNLSSTATPGYSNSLAFAKDSTSGFDLALINYDNIEIAAKV
jgi:hypothetical protein